MRARGEERKRLRWWWGGYRFIRANAASAARGVTEEEQGQRVVVESLFIARHQV